MRACSHIVIGAPLWMGPVRLSCVCACACVCVCVCVCVCARMWVCLSQLLIPRTTDSIKAAFTCKNTSKGADQEEKTLQSPTFFSGFNVDDWTMKS